MGLSHQTGVWGPLCWTSKTDSIGGVCYNCRMSYMTYGLFKAIRSHTVNSPMLQSSLEMGRPNACNQCHRDKMLTWSYVSIKRSWQIRKGEVPTEA